MFRGIFVTGTDTNVGKTVVSAALMLRYRDEAPLRYWKPIQTGVEQDDDTREVRRLTARGGADDVLERGIRLRQPVSPHLAASRAGTRIAVRALVEILNEADRSLRASHAGTGPRWIIEGAGGVLVPINERETMADLMHTFDLPVLVTARSTLGTINHTLMTIEALRRRMLRVAGVIMIGPPDRENRIAIEKYGAAEVVAEMPPFDPLAPQALAHWVNTAFDRSGVLFGCLR